MSAPHLPSHQVCDKRRVEDSQIVQEGLGLRDLFLGVCFCSAVFVLCFWMFLDTKGFQTF